MGGRMSVRSGRISRLSLVAGALLALALAVAACGSTASDKASPGTPKPGGTYNFPLGLEPPSIEPLNAQESEGMQVAHQIFQGLARYEPQADGSLLAVPDIAESWSSNDDATVWTFRLKHGVTFQRPVGREVTARGFVDAWNYVTDPANQSYMVYVLAPIKGSDAAGYAKGGLRGVKALDRYTLQVTLKYPFAELPQILGMPVAAVWPLAYMKKIGHQAFQSRPIGTGPYMVAKWAHGKYIDLVRNPDYWDVARAGYVDSIHLPIIPPPEEQWREFQKGSIDMMWVRATGVPQVDTVENDPNVKSGTWTATKWPMLCVAYIGLNQRSPRLGGAANLPLRQALNYSVDQKALIDGALEGVPAEPKGFVPDGIPGADLSALAYPFDQGRAEKLMTQSGGDASLDYWYRTEPGYARIARVLQAGWAKVGIRVTLNDFEWGTLVSKLTQGEDDELFITGWLADYPSIDDFLYPLFHSGSSGTGSCTSYNNPEFDRLLEQARATTDAGRRLRLYAQAERLVLSDAPVIPLYFYRDYRITNNRVQNQVFNPMGQVDMWKVWVK